jgi:hypothetical protein
LIESLDREFHKLYSSWCSLIQACTNDTLYTPVGGKSVPPMGVSVLRSAAVVEQTCGGITSNLWDDPFEWTLPETLGTPQSVLEHLDEVEALRSKAFTTFTDDGELLKEVATPSGELQMLSSLLLQTLAHASEFYGQALIVAKIPFRPE